MTVRVPAPLRPGDRIGVTAPSAGVPAPLRPRFEHCVRWLEERGYEVVVGECLDGGGVVSAGAQARAAELTAMLTDPSIRAIVPPWGGELAIEILPYLDWAEIASAEPTWLVGYSDLSTVLLPLTTRSGIATLHGQCLMETPYELPPEVTHWTSVLAAERGSTLEQRASTHHRSSAAGHDHWETNPEAATFTLDEAGPWRLLHGDRVDVTGTLIGGCAEVLGPLAGTPYGDVRGFAEQAGGLIVYVEAAEDAALNIARHLWSMRLAGWFDHANAILIGRTHAPASGGFSQDDAVRSALGDLGIPVVLDVDCGHVPPQLALVNGATARVVVDGTTQSITQTLGL